MREQYDTVTKSFAENPKYLKYIHRAFAVESEFPESHCMNLSKEQQRIISEWIETGVHF